MEQERQLILSLINFAWANSNTQLDIFQIRLMNLLQPTALRVQYNPREDVWEFKTEEKR